jgi:GTP cyclohydrolase II
VEVFQDPLTNQEHVALLYGQYRDVQTLVRVHSSCFTSEVFHSLRCDCEHQLTQSLEQIKQNGAGILIYLSQEGRGIGLFEKIKAYKLQDQGLDTVDANLALGHLEDDRSYYVAIQILKHYEVSQFNLLTNNPRKVNALNRFFTVTRRSLHATGLGPNANKYVNTKFDRLGHMRES